MKTLRQFSIFAMTFLFVSILACAAGQSHAQETTGQYIGDTVITTEIKAKIFAEKDLNATEIHVETYKGTVQLSGFVSQPEQIRKAEEVAGKVSGVKKVENSIKLKDSVSD